MKQLNSLFICIFDGMIRTFDGHSFNPTRPYQLQNTGGIDSIM